MERIARLSRNFEEIYESLLSIVALVRGSPTPMSDQLTKKKFPYPVAVTLFLVLVLLVLFLWWGVPYLFILEDADKTRELIRGFGIWSPIIFIIFQILQVFFAPIPGQATGLLGGYLFGTIWGTVYTMVGAIIGFTAIFILTRRLGRPFVEYFVSDNILEKFDYLSNTKGIIALFVIFLLPAFPDDAICYIAGLTKIKIRTLILISVIGRLPGYVILSLIGSGVATGSTVEVTVITVLSAVAAFVVYVNRVRIESLVRKLNV